MYIRIIKARDIPDAWFQCLSDVQDFGFRYVIQQGSFVGQTRLEFDFIVVEIAHPYSEPYNTMLPEIPEHLGIPNPVNKDYLDQYLPYLMTSERAVGEAYTYGQRINGFTWWESFYDKMGREDLQFAPQIPFQNHLNQVEHMIELLKRTPNTNQAILQIAIPQDCSLDDPPCLRHIDMRVKTWTDGVGIENKKLIFYPYFRSWDLWAGFPANLAAIAILQKYMADEIGVGCGEIVASSKGLHIYGYAEQLAKMRCKK